MDSQASAPERETGKKLHQRETWWQITLPFVLALVLVLGLGFGIGFPNHPDWRYRAEAIASLSYILLCLFPILLCLFMPYLLLILGIYGMLTLHRSTETPLLRLENAANSLAKRVNDFSVNIDEKAATFEEAFAPAYKVFSIFDKPEEESDEPREENPS